MLDMVTKTNKKKNKNKGGRPSVIDETILSKLEDAFSFALTDEESCRYAGISPATLYRYQEKNEEFRERKMQLKLTPNLAAHKTIVKALESNVTVAQWWLSKKKPDEFGDTTKLKIEGNIKKDDSLSKEDADRAIEAFEQALRGPLTTKK